MKKNTKIALLAASAALPMAGRLLLDGRRGQPGWDKLLDWRYAHRGLYDNENGVPENSLAAFRLAAENAVFGQPECGLGIIPGFGGTQRLARLVGMGRAKEMIFTCDNIDAAEAYRIGLVNKVVAKEELMETAKTMAAKIISKGSYAVSVAKAAINNGYDMDIRNAVEMEANLFGVVNDTHDKKEGMGAFLEKRKADLTDF